MIQGNIQRRWQEEMPQFFEKESRTVCFDVKEETRTENDRTVSGYSFLQVQIDKQIDYGHIKSQLIEAGFAQKDEFGLLMNAVESIVKALTENTSLSSVHAAMKDEDIDKFTSFCEFRELCAQTAKEIMNYY